MMGTFRGQDIVGDVVASQPVLSRAFDAAGIDYCCGGRKTLNEVCQKKGLDAEAFIKSLDDCIKTSSDEPVVDAVSMSLTDLVDHIEETHHLFLWTELPRLERMTDKVARAHGKANTNLFKIRETFHAMSGELTSHMMKEEKILFPMIRQLDASEVAPVFHRGTLANPIQQMESEHTDAGDALRVLRELSDDYTPPDWACNTYRAMLDGLFRVEEDLHQHVHKENNILFPRAIKMESDRCA